DRDGIGAVRFKHQGFYAYRKAALDAFHRLPQSPLELTEKLEQLRFLENGIDIVVVETTESTIGVATEADLQAVPALLAHRARAAPRGAGAGSGGVSWRRAADPPERPDGLPARGPGAPAPLRAGRAEQQSRRRPGAAADRDAERRERVRPRRSRAPEQGLEGG